MTNDILDSLHVLMTGVKDPMLAVNEAVKGVLPQSNTENAVLSLVLGAVRQHLVTKSGRVEAVKAAQIDVTSTLQTGVLPAWVSLATASDILADMQLSEIAQRDKAISYVKKVFTWVLSLLGI